MASVRFVETDVAGREMIDARIGDNVTMPDLPKAARRFVNGDEILGRYVVQDELGQGGMGVVYRCFDKIGGVEVAVKGLPPEVSHNSDEMEAVRENFQLVSELHHPNIAGVRTLEKDLTTGDYYLVMTLARGVSLRHWLCQHGGKEHRAEQLNVLRQIASALDYAHNAEPKHIIHRDVKPENIMVDDGGHVMVLDFGLAAQVRSSLSRVSQVVTSRSGTPAYKSPEQWLAQAQRAPSDQYSLGVIAYQMFAGELPFDSDDPEILKHAVVFDPMPPIPGETKTVNVVLAKVLAKKPQERFVSCVAFIDALCELNTRPRVCRAPIFVLSALFGVIGAFCHYLSSPSIYEDRRVVVLAGDGVASESSTEIVNRCISTLSSYETVVKTFIQFRSANPSSTLSDEELLAMLMGRRIECLPSAMGFAVVVRANDPTSATMILNAHVSAMISIANSNGEKLQVVMSTDAPRKIVFPTLVRVISLWGVLSAVFALVALGICKSRKRNGKHYMLTRQGKVKRRFSTIRGLLLLCAGVLMMLLAECLLAYWMAW